MKTKEELDREIDEAMVKLQHDDIVEDSSDYGFKEIVDEIENLQKNATGLTEAEVDKKRTELLKKIKESKEHKQYLKDQRAEQKKIDKEQSSLAHQDNIERIENEKKATEETENAVNDIWNKVAAEIK